MIATASAPAAQSDEEFDGVVIDNIGPIEHLELDAKPGTVTVLRGWNGNGKSTALDAISALTRGEGKLESRDGTVGGKATGFGVQIKVGRGGANRRTGDLVVTAVEDRLSIADFVEPPIKDPVAADARRLKALVSLVGLAADPQQFAHLVGGADRFAELVKPETLKHTDPIAMAEAIKRDFESASRLANTKAERLYGEMQAKTAANDNLDLNAEHDGDVLQRRLEMALSEVSALEERQRQAGQLALKRQQAQAALDKSQANYTGPTVSAAQQAVESAVAARDSACLAADEQYDRVVDLREKLRDAEEEHARLSDHAGLKASELNAANNALTAVQQHEATLASWRETLAAPVDSTAAPSDDVLEAARQQVQAARKANETGVLIRAAKQRLTEATALDAERKAAVKLSESLRDAAKSVLDVLAAGVKELVPGITIDEEFRIVVPHPKRTTCYYSDLSHGERWKMALDIAVAAFERKGERGVLAIPQEAWEGLDGRNRRLIADHVAETDLIVFTAEAERSMEETAEPLAVEVLS